MERAEALLLDHKWDFRAAGPPLFLMLIRSLNGWLHSMRELRVTVDLSAVLP